MEKTKMIDFLTEKIFEEGADANIYIEHASSCGVANIKSTLSKIAEDELGHQRQLVKLLADIAKGTGEEFDG